MTLTGIHGRVANAMLLFSVIAAIWGLVLFLRGRKIDGNYWGILATGELLFLAQALLGAILWLQGARPARAIHLLYGIVAVLTLPAVYAFNRGRDDRRAALAYGLILLFLAGISLRAMGTAL
jgi:hypothetical protein